MPDQERGRPGRQALEAALDCAGLVWWHWDLASGALAWSSRAADLLGFAPPSSAEVAGLPLASAILEEDAGAAREAMAGLLAGRRPMYEARYRVRGGSGEPLWLCDRGKVTARSEDGAPLSVSGAFQDIGQSMNGVDERGRLLSELQRLNAELEVRVSASTEELRSANEELRVYQVELEAQNEELRRTQLRLEESRSRFTHLYDFAPIAYFTLDREGLILEANLKFASMLGMERNRLLRKPVSVFLASESQETLFRYRQRLLETLRPQTEELLMKRRDGTSFHARLEGSAEIAFEGPTGRVRIAMLDISEQKLAQELREDMERIARHDLKTPLNAVIGLPQIMMLEGGLTEEQRQSLAQIEEAGYRMLHSINLSLGLFRMERGTYEYDPHPLDALMQLRRACWESGSLASARNVTFAFEVEGRPAAQDEVYMILGEEPTCYSMFANLVKNALEASPQGGVVRISIRRLPEGLDEIAITNSGVVPESMRGVFFEKYATAGKKGGTGIGTYSARLIARTMGGDVDFESDEEHGTTVFVRLPSLE